MGVMEGIAGGVRVIRKDQYGTNHVEDGFFQRMQGGSRAKDNGWDCRTENAETQWKKTQHGVSLCIVS